MKPVMLALSTFRYSEKAIQLALEKASDGRPLLIVYVVDENIARYYFGVDVGYLGDLKETCEKDLLRDHEQKGQERVSRIAEEGHARGIEVRTRIYTGRFAVKCLEVIREEDPEMVITTRTQRPEWVRKFFGSPVDQLIAEARRPVIEA